MSVLEIILVGVLWVAYGVFSAYQSEDCDFRMVDPLELFIAVAGAPVILVIRIFIGVFSKRTMF